MIALSSKETALQDFFTHRIMSGDLKGRNAGNVFFESINDMCDGNLSKTVDEISKILDMRGSVIPATLDNVTIGAVLTDGSRVIGKKNIEEVVEEKQVGIEKIFLVPERCSPAQDVIRSIKEADVIIGQEDDDVVSIVPFKIAAVICKLFVTRVGKAQKHHIGLSLKPFKNHFHRACDVVLIINLGGEIFNIDEVESAAGGEGDDNSK